MVCANIKEASELGSTGFLWSWTPLFWNGMVIEKIYYNTSLLAWSFYQAYRIPSRPTRWYISSGTPAGQPASLFRLILWLFHKVRNSSNSFSKSGAKMYPAVCLYICKRFLTIAKKLQSIFLYLCTMLLGSYKPRSTNPWMIIHVVYMHAGIRAPPVNINQTNHIGIPWTSQSTTESCDTSVETTNLQFSTYTNCNMSPWFAKYVVN